MLPEFPKFKKLELSDKEDVERFTKKFPPYSDFNFVSMWSWDIKGEMRISQQHGNLIVRFTDYITGEPFYSFLGDQKVDETARALLEFSKKEGLKPELKLVPEDSIKNLDPKKFEIKEDRDHFDYIYDLKQLNAYKGRQFVNKRNKVKKFLNSLPSAKIKILNLKEKSVRAEILELDRAWGEHKKNTLNLDIENELFATEKLFEGDFPNLICVGVFDGALIGYSIFQVNLKDNYSISHFCKASKNFKGIYDFLLQECSKILTENGVFYLNYEQDLGLLGLRENKTSFLYKFLKKFVVTLQK